MPHAHGSSVPGGADVRAPLPIPTTGLGEAHRGGFGDPLRAPLPRTRCM